MLTILYLAAFALLTRVSGHSALWHPSMYGFNVTDKTFPYDNRPVVPIKNMNFTTWWFHNHLDHPPHPGDIFELQAGKPATTEIACNKGATSFFASSEGGDIRDPANLDYPCPKSPTTAFHTNDFNDLEGCALAIAYKNDAKAVEPEDFTVFSVNHTCVWTRFTDFQVPARMPPCPPGGCICAFFWIHSPKSGGEENYMNGFKCNVTDSISTVPLAKSKVPRRCGADSENGKLEASPSNCTYGAKTPFYWFNTERNNMFEGAFSPPVYNDRYNFLDGAQEDIFVDSYLNLPDPAPNAAMPIVADVSAKMPIGGVPVVSPSAANTTSPKSGKSCSKKSASPSSLDSSSSYVAKREVPPASISESYLRGNLIALGKRSRRLDIKHRNRLWQMW